MTRLTELLIEAAIFHNWQNAHLDELQCELTELERKINTMKIITDDDYAKLLADSQANADANTATHDLVTASFSTLTGQLTDTTKQLNDIKQQLADEGSAVDLSGVLNTLEAATKEAQATGAAVSPAPVVTVPPVDTAPEQPVDTTPPTETPVDGTQPTTDPQTASVDPNANNTTETPTL